jgi:hypothetical protein
MSVGRVRDVIGTRVVDAVEVVVYVWRTWTVWEEI